MISNSKPNLSSTSLYKTVQKVAISVQDLPQNAILLDSLKTLELQLQRRGIIGLELGDVHFAQPIWFSAETERNIFLWRSGLSLADVENFEFWIDVEKLVEKRLTLLEGSTADNPFVNPLWGSNSVDPSTAKKEAEYLRSFMAVLSSIEAHANALSKVTSAILRDTYTEQKEKQIILIP